jgi:hypothetical protein
MTISEYFMAISVKLLSQMRNFDGIVNREGKHLDLEVFKIKTGRRWLTPPACLLFSG